MKITSLEAGTLLRWLMSRYDNDLASKEDYKLGLKLFEAFPEQKEQHNYLFSKIWSENDVMEYRKSQAKEK